MKKKTIVNKKRKKLRKLSSFFSYYINIQGCALAVPKNPWHPLFTLELWGYHSGFHRFRALGFPSIYTKAQPCYNNYTNYYGMWIFHDYFNKMYKL